MIIHDFLLKHRVTIRNSIYYAIIFVAIMLALLLISCNKIQDQPLVIEKPIAINLPKPIVPKLSPLPISELSDYSEPPEVIKAYVETVYIQQKYIKILNAILSDY